jgi:hypothetical protein
VERSAKRKLKGRGIVSWWFVEKLCDFLNMIVCIQSLSLLRGGEKIRGCREFFSPMEWRGGKFVPVKVGGMTFLDNPNKFVSVP